MSGFLGHCSTDVLGGHRINPLWAHAIAAMSPDPIIRHGAYWPDIAKVGKDGSVTFDWQQTHDNVGVLRDAGLRFYLNPFGIPTYAAAGLTCYLEGVGGCLWWNDPRDASKGLKFTPERPGCSNPPDPDGAAIADFGARVVQEFPDAESVAFLNEGDDYVSSPAVMHSTELRFGGNWSATSEWYTEKFLVPFYKGVRSASIRMPVSGAEWAYPGTMRASLDWQIAHNQRAWDWEYYTSMHLYAGDTPGVWPQTAYAQLDKAGGWWNYLDTGAHNYGIEKLFIGETGNNASDDQDGWLMLIHALMARDDVSGLVMLSDAMWKPESITNADPMKNTYEPSELYGRLQKSMSRATSRHRAVRRV